MSNESVIDNENVFLLDQLKDMLPETSRVSIAVGYFFVTGFAPIMDSFARIEASSDPNHVIRLLISPTTNRPTAEALLAINESLEDVQRRAQTDDRNGRATVSRQFANSLAHMKQTDSDRQTIIKLHDLISRGKLQVRAYTKERLHAKAYIFEFEGDKRLPKMSIVGSSNLSLSGIRENTELNLRTNQNEDTEKLLKWFDRHWEESEEFTEEIADIMKGSWIHDREPQDVYHKAILNEHDSDDVDIDHPSTTKLFDFQKMAVASAISKINNYGGVIIADVVGTGKSYIGSMILKYLKETNHSKPLIICPPQLVDMWSGYMDAFEVNAEIISRYKIGKEGHSLNKYSNCDVILIDESHNFRNRTRAYEALYDFMKQQPDESCIIMLTATPISNSVTDIKNQLSLFPGDRIHEIPSLGDTTLDEYFKGAEQNNKITPEGEEKIRELLRHILIRRTRKHIQENHAKRDGNRYYLESPDGQRKYFPKRHLVNPREYDIDCVYQDSFERIQDYIEQLKLARYQPGKYITDEYRNTTHPEYTKYNNLANSMMSLTGMVRTSLLKRMESSIAAFHSSVRNFERGSDIFLRFLKKGIVPIGKYYHDTIYESIMSDNDGCDDMIDVPTSEYDIKAFDVAAWKADIIKDIEVFASIGRLLPDKDDFVLHDDKLEGLLDIIKDRSDQKILLFTESLVTAQYVYKYLHEKLPDLHMNQIDSKKSTREKNNMVKCFDPENNNATIPVEDELQVLISTDVLAEGVNLQAGKTIINYDFHWNPVRLIQRIGRIDRIGTRHRAIDVINFLPATKIETELRLQERVANKIDTIRRIIGHDQKILEPTEVIDKNAVTDIYLCREDVLDADSDGVLDMIQTSAEIDADKIHTNAELREHVKSLPLGIRCAVGNNRLLVVCEAVERILQDDKELLEKPFRRYYEITAQRIQRMRASSFLKVMGESIHDITQESDNANYDGLISTAYRKFVRDMKNEQGKNKKKTRAQLYFERRLMRMKNPLGRRAQKIIPSVTKMMVTNKQPYRSLNDLRKRVDRDGMDDESVLQALEVIFERKYNYRKEIVRPKIVCSMGVV